MTLAYSLILFDGALESGYSVEGGMRVANGYLIVSVNEDLIGQGYVTPAIYVTNYTTLHVIAKQNPIPNSGHVLGLSVKASGSTWYSDFAVSIGNIAQTDTEYSLDISALSGNYYFRMGMYSGSISCKKVWFE